MKLLYLAATFFLLATVPSWAAVPETTLPPPIRLWEGDAPGALGHDPKDIPSLAALPAPAATATGAALLVCPGGGYGYLADPEAVRYAQYFNKEGISCYVLKYRLGPDGYHHPAMLQDVTRAMRFVRAHAAEWKLDPKRIGIVGSSAGGHLAATLLTHFDTGNPAAADPIERVSSRPDLAVLCYPVLTMGANGHPSSKRNLLGPKPSPELERELSTELNVRPQIPPCFIFQALADPAVNVENTLELALALRKAGVPFSLHIYQDGGHGIGLHPAHPWPGECTFWLKARGFLSPAGAPTARPAPVEPDVTQGAAPQ